MINLVIGAVVCPPPAKRDIYEVVVAVMSGDGDHYEDMTMSSQGADDISAVVSLMTQAVGQDWSDSSKVCSDAVYGLDEQKYWRDREILARSRRNAGLVL